MPEKLSREPQPSLPSREAIDGLVQYVSREGLATTKRDVNGTVAFALGVNPAIEYKHEDLTETQLPQQLENLGIEALFHKWWVVNSKLLEDRLEQDRSFAEEIGWDFDHSLVENIKSTLATGGKIDHAKFGFILDYPVSAIRAYMRADSLGKRGLMTPSQVNMVKPSADWDEQDRNAVQAMKLEGTMQRSALAKKYRADWLRIYTAYLGATPEEAEFLLSLRGRSIKNPAGETIYNFVVAGEEGAQAPDVLALEDKVTAAFKSIETTY